MIDYSARSLLGSTLRINSCGGRERSRTGQRKQFDCGAVWEALANPQGTLKWQWLVLSSELG